MNKKIRIFCFEGNKAKTEYNFVQAMKKTFKKDLLEMYHIADIKVIKLELNCDPSKISKQIKLNLTDSLEDKFEYINCIYIDSDEPKRYNLLHKHEKLIKEEIFHYESSYNIESLKYHLVVPWKHAFEFIILACLINQKKLVAHSKTQVEKQLTSFFKNGKKEWCNLDKIIQKFIANKETVLINLEENLVANHATTIDSYQKNIKKSCDFGEIHSFKIIFTNIKGA